MASGAGVLVRTAWRPLGLRPDVEEQGAASAGTAGGGREDGSTRGASGRGAQSRRTVLRAGRGRWHAAEEKQGRKRGR
jgi:hypothetical protein